MARIQDLVKTYKVVNDPKAPAWNIKFVGGVVSAGALAASFVLLLWAGPEDPGVAAAVAAPHSDAPIDLPPPPPPRELPANESAEELVPLPGVPVP